MRTMISAQSKIQTTAQSLVSGSMAALQAQTSLNLSNHHHGFNVEAPSTVPELCYMLNRKSNNLKIKKIKFKNELKEKSSTARKTIQRISWVDVTNHFIQHKPLSAQAGNGLFGVTAA
eukprot:scpid105430/ scgid35463/ 